MIRRVGDRDVAEALLVARAGEVLVALHELAAQGPESALREHGCCGLLLLRRGYCVRAKVTDAVDCG